MAIHIRRRELMFTLGGAAVGWLLAARAQQVGKLPTIGFLGATTPAGGRPAACRFRSAAARTWLGRRSQCGDRGSLGRGRQRALRRDRHRIGPAQGRCHSHAQHPTRPRSQASDIRSSRSCSRQRAIQSAPAWLPVWRDGGKRHGYDEGRNIVASLNRLYGPHSIAAHRANIDGQFLCRRCQEHCPGNGFRSPSHSGRQPCEHA